ncbi:MAG: CinA family protein [Pseudomonadota bacterium]
MFSDDLIAQSTALLQAARDANVKLATAESCTGGLIAGLLTEIPGSSDVVDRGFVTYSNAAKMALLGVPETDIQTHGAVSEIVATAMVAGALTHADADVAVAVTGVAGPGGGTAAKPVGLVWMAAQRRDQTVVTREMRYGDTGRTAVRLATVRDAIALMQAQI